MKVVTKCFRCEAEISKQIFTADRGELEREVGKKIELRCKQCLEFGEYHLNDLRAEPNKVLLLIALIGFLILTPFIFYFLSDFIFSGTFLHRLLSIFSVGTVPVSVLMIIQKNERKRTESFNRYKIRD